MNILFSAYCNNRQHFIKVSNDMLNGSQRVCSKVASAIKNGFVALLQSISNSFKCLVKMFTFTKTSGNLDNSKQERSFSITAPAVMIEKEKEKTLEYDSFNDISRLKFEKLKASMHAELNDLFSRRASV